MNNLTIAEVSAVCTAWRARFLDLAELGGVWALSDEPGPRQRSWLAVSRRHARHAELCVQRCPTIPIVDIDAAVADRRGELSAPDRPATDWYARVVAEIHDDITSVRDRGDPDLDPATARLCSLLLADLKELP